MSEARVMRTVAELRRRREQHRIASAHYWGEGDERLGDKHDHMARGLSVAIDVLSEIFETQSVPSATDARELSIVEVTESTHRRRTYTAAAGEAEAILETWRFNADGWRPTGSRELEQLAIDGERIFADR